MSQVKTVKAQVLAVLGVRGRERKGGPARKTLSRGEGC